MDPSVARALSLLGIRMAKLENAMSVFRVAGAYDEVNGEELPARYAEMFKNINIDERVISGSPLLLSLYKSESLKLTPQCVGTWPDDNRLARALCLFGGCAFRTGEACEEIRLGIIPELIAHQVPFSVTQVDRGEKAPYSKIASLLAASPSHLLIDAHGMFNFVNRVAAAYLLGRGHGMVYNIRRASSEGGETVPNLYGCDGKFTNTQRSCECDRLLLSMSREQRTGAIDPLEFQCFSGGDESQRSFFNSVLRIKPDALQKHEPQTVAARRQHWNEILDGDPIVTDIGLIVACAYVAGMLSPRARGHYFPVPRDAIGKADEWCGRIKTLMLLGQVIRPGAPELLDNEVRAALEFLCVLLDTETENR